MTDLFATKPRRKGVHLVNSSCDLAPRCVAFLSLEICCRSWWKSSSEHALSLTGLAKRIEEHMEKKFHRACSSARCRRG